MKHRFIKNRNKATEFQARLSARCVAYAAHCNYVVGRNLFSIRLVDCMTGRKVVHLRVPAKDFPSDELKGASARVLAH
jgi:hypothetical protein